jgi:hypothetical protein
MSKAKIIAKIEADGGEYEEGRNFYGEYVFEAWLPEGLIWDNAHQSGIGYYESGQFGSMKELWEYVGNEINHPVKKAVK